MVFIWLRDEGIIAKKTEERFYELDQSLTHHHLGYYRYPIDLCFVEIPAQR
jgi:hypothetical protein